MNTTVEQREEWLNDLNQKIAKSEAAREIEKIVNNAVIHEQDDLIPPPAVTPSLFYGIVKKIAFTAAEGTEVNPVAAATAYLSFLGANVGRDTFFYIGNTPHHPRLFTLHVGRSGRARKGDSMQLTLRIRQHINQKDNKLLGQLHSGGLSSKEGMASLIQDAHGEKAGVEDKRIWFIESEFANVMNQFKMSGNSLSVGVRQAWDGGDIAPATKNGRTWASAPHIGIHANITPTELVSVMSSRDMSNGFANRFLMIFAEKSAQVPFPKATPDPIIEALAEETAEILFFAKGKYPETQNTRQMHLSEDAVEFYKGIYSVLDNPLQNEMITGLLERRAPYALRLAMLFALTDLTLVIERTHLEAAFSWVNYAVQSVQYIFKDKAHSTNVDEVTHIAEKIVLFLEDKPKGCTKTAINTECFKGNLNAQQINKALDYLLTCIPAKIERIETKKAGRGRNSSLYSLKKITKKTKKFETHAGRGFDGVT